ncbi:MAG: response regulator [Gloeotrichia echinulata DVL01]|jgi:twitching motility two-component system response regulator PilG
MQGNLNEIDIRSLLQLMELGQKTGQLLVEAKNCQNCEKLDGYETNRHHYCRKCQQQRWLVFLWNGQIIYCQEGDRSGSRIGDYLRHYRIEIPPDEIHLASLTSLNPPEYTYLWALLERNMINPKVARNIIHGLVHETLFDLLSLHQGSFIFHQSSVIAPQLTSLEITPLVTKITKQLQEWKQLYPEIQSPEQLPMLADIVQLNSSLPTKTINKLQHWADGKTSLRQLARYLNRDILTVAKAIYPYVQQGWLKIVYKRTDKNSDCTTDVRVESNYRGRIVCIDDTTSIGETIESILQPQGYEAIAITNPLEALSLVFQLQPDLIFCEITMPKLDGYEICAMLRHSQAFAFVPIIMLTAKDGFNDRLRAKMVGATDYLTKPFDDTELLMLIEKYLNRA